MTIEDGMHASGGAEVVDQEAQRTAQKAVIAQLGLDALNGLAVPQLMAAAVQQAAHTLGVEFAMILELLPGGESFLMVAGVGWLEGLVGSVRVGAEGDSLAGYTLRSLEPVVVEDMNKETRFGGASLLRDHGVMSSLSVLIHGRGGPFGVFGVHSQKPRRFWPHDANFLQAIANVVGTAIERQQAEQALRKSQQRLAVAVEASGAGIYEHAVPIGDDVYHSARWAEILGFSLEEVPHDKAFVQWVLQRLHPRDSSLQAETYRDFVQGRRKSYDMQQRLKHKSGRWVWVRSFAQALERDEEGRVKRLAGMMFDISSQKEAQEEREQLVAAQQMATEQLEERVQERTQQLQKRTEQLRAMASSLTVAEQRERERISRILHDDLQQLLYAAQMQASLLQSELPQAENERLKEQIRELERLHDRAVNVARSLAVELSPPVLEGEGLVQALGWLQNHMENNYGLKVALTVVGHVELENSDLRELLFQMVRELLFNVVKHAGVALAQVTLRVEGEHIVIDVADQGRGFDAAMLDDKRLGNIGYGIRSMRERLALFDGDLQMETGVGKGTRVRIVVGRE